MDTGLEAQAGGRTKRVSQLRARMVVRAADAVSPRRPLRASLTRRASHEP